MDAPILIVEDDAEIRELLGGFLADEGFAVRAVADGRGMDRAFAEAVPRLVILDVMLPGRSGYDILRDIRADPVMADLPVLMLTARGQTRDRELAAAAGASHFMAKPFSNAEVLQTVRSLAGPA